MRSPADRPTAAQSLWGAGAQLALGRVLGALALLVGTRLLTEVVPPQVFGEYAFALAAVYLARNIYVVPLTFAVARFYPELALRGELATLRGALAPWSRGWTLATVLATLALIAAALATGQSWSVSALLCGAIVLVLLRRELEIALLNAARRHRAFSIWDAAEAWARPLLAIGAVLLWQPSAEALLLGFLVALAGALLTARLLLPARPAAGAMRDPANTRRVMRYLWPIVPIPLLGWVTGLGDRYAIAWLDGFEQVGLYAAVYGLMSQPYLMLEQIARLTFSPVYFHAIAEGDQATQQRTFTRWIATVVGLGAVGVVATVFLRHALADVLLAQSYRHAADLMPWIAGGNALLALARVFESPLYAQHSPRRVLIGQLLSALAAIAVGLPMIAAYGAWGAAVACPIYFGLQCGVTIALGARRPPVAPTEHSEELRP